MLRKKLSGHKAANYKKSCKWGITGEEAKIKALGSGSPRCRTSDNALPACLVSLSFLICKMGINSVFLMRSYEDWKGLWVGRMVTGRHPVTIIGGTGYLTLAGTVQTLLWYSPSCAHRLLVAVSSSFIHPQPLRCSHMATHLLQLLPGFWAGVADLHIVRCRGSHSSLGGWHGYLF